MANAKKHVLTKGLANSLLDFVENEYRNNEALRGAALSEVVSCIEDPDYLTAVIETEATSKNDVESAVKAWLQRRVRVWETVVYS